MLKYYFSYVKNTSFFIGVSYGIFILFFTLYSVFDPSVLVDSFQFHITPQDGRPRIYYNPRYGYCIWNSRADLTKAEIGQSYIDFRSMWMGFNKDISYEDFLKKWDKDPTFREIFNHNFNKMLDKAWSESGGNYALFDRKAKLYIDLSKVGLTMDQQRNLVLIKKIP